MTMDAIELKFAITCGLALAAIIAVAIGCSRLEKKIDAMQDLNDKKTKC